MNFSNQQAAGIDAVGKWHKAKDKGRPVFRLMGFAGTGKTTIAKHIADSIEGHTVYCSFTGKAALVMQKNGCSDASTIHSLIYSIRTDTETGDIDFELNADSDAKHAALIVVDECSMVNEDLGADLLSFKTPVLVLGDPEQLPPVKGAGYFVNGTADVMLTEIHRQARDNPIVSLATDIREGRKLSVGDYGESRVITRAGVNGDDVKDADQVLVGLNRTRQSYNRRLRELHNFNSDYPVIGDRLVCLKNDREKQIFNGGIFTVAKKTKRNKEHVVLTIESNDFDDRAAFTAKARKECFDGGLVELDWRKRKGYQEFDYGYALTVHKSQGSQWDDVYIFNESAAFAREENAPRRWLYTAVTRAADRVTVVQ